MKRILKSILLPIKNSLCYRYYYKEDIDEKKVFLESRNAIDFAGNMLRIALEISNNYSSHYSITIPFKKGSKKKIDFLLKRYGLNNVELVKYNSIRYFKAIYQSKFIMTDATFPDSFIKKDNQVYLNVWHGTPYKKMGRDSKSGSHVMNNVQRNLFMSDYLLFPNKYCQEIMTHAYSLNGLYNGTVLHEGYPRNTVFFDDELRMEIKKQYNLLDKRIYVYMPTFRETMTTGLHDQQIEMLSKYFALIDKELDENEVLYVKLHYYLNNVVDISHFKHIRLFPEDVETYEFLNIADTLITDYSSVMYDFAITKKPVIQFLYDVDNYDENRGFYEQPIKLPFLCAYSVDELIGLLHSELNVDYSDEFLNMYCTYENKNATSNILSRVLNGKEIISEESLFIDSKKIILYGGALDKNGITTSLVNLVTKVQNSREQYYICFSRKTLGNNVQNLNVISDIHNVYEVSGVVYNTIIESFAMLLFYILNINNSFVKNVLDKMYNREIRRNFLNMDFDVFIQFVGYERMMISLFQRAKKNRIIYVHSDMNKELKTRANQLRLTLKNAYEQYDKVAVVSNSVAKSVKRITKQNTVCYLCENLQDFDGIIRKAKEPIETQYTTIVYKDGMNLNESFTCSEKNESITDFLDRFKHNFITIGRFSPEKNHKRLIEAFELYCNDSDDTGLVIIGGHGELFTETVNRVSQSPVRDRILLINSINNPIPILNRCDCFVLSSDYEGFPMVFHEATIVGLPIISCADGSSKLFLKKYGGLVVDNSSASICDGMKHFTKKGISLMNIDYQEYNSKCICQFKNLL